MWGARAVPFELGLGWLVDFHKTTLFNGRSALLKEQAKGSRYRFAMLDVEGNKPAEHSFILKGDKQVGTVTSAAWCPTAKANIAYAQIEMPSRRRGRRTGCGNLLPAGTALDAPAGAMQGDRRAHFQITQALADARTAPLIHSHFY